MRGSPSASGHGTMERMICLVIVDCDEDTTLIAFPTTVACIRSFQCEFHGWELLPNQLEHPRNGIAFDPWLFRDHVCMKRLGCFGDSTNIRAICPNIPRVMSIDGLSPRPTPTSCFGGQFFRSRASHHEKESHPHPSFLSCVGVCPSNSCELVLHALVLRTSPCRPPSPSVPKKKLPLACPSDHRLTRSS